MQADCDRHALSFRPHEKTHKMIRVARQQLEASAIGITCQKLREAELMARHGLGDILVTFPLVGVEKATSTQPENERVSVRSTPEDAEYDIVVDSVPEDMELKVGVLRPLDLVIREGLGRRWRHVALFEAAALGGVGRWKRLGANLLPLLSSEDEPSSVSSPTATCGSASWDCSKGRRRQRNWPR